MIKNIIVSIINVCHNWIINFAFGIFPLKKQFTVPMVRLNLQHRFNFLTPNNKGMTQ